MKYILQIAAALKIGGAEKVAFDIGMFADKKEYEVHYIVFGNEIGEYEEELVKNGCKIFHIKSPGANYFSFVFYLIKLMKEYKYSAVHAHTMFNCGLVMLAGKIAGVPVRISHAHSALNNGNGFVKGVYEKIMRFLILKCSTDLVSCGNEAGERLFGKKAYCSKGKLILNGTDIEKFRYSEKSRERIRELYNLGNRFVIGHTGHLAKVKNQSFILELMPEILKKRSDTVLFLLGEGEDRKMLENKIFEMNISDNVIMTGNVMNVEEYMSAFDVFVFPSLFEGMPLSIIEVQSNGLPCVISTGVPEDVFITDLIHPHSLSEKKEYWVDEIFSVKRESSIMYADIMEKSGLGVKGTMSKIYEIYSGV